MSRPFGLFITGTHTGIGKTTVAAWLSLHYGATYFKPVQTGAASEKTDAQTLREICGTSGRYRIRPSEVVLQAPLDPWAASVLENKTLSLQRFSPLEPSDTPYILEGAGGVLVPLSGAETVADMIAFYGLAAVVVASTELGTINHTLLSLQALRLRRCSVAGVIFHGPSPNEPAQRALRQFETAPLLAYLPLWKNVGLQSLAETPLSEPLEELARRRFAI